MFDDDKKDGSLRLMTLGEIKMAKEIFRDTLIYPKVWIHKGSYLPFGLQLKRVSMSPNGEMYFRDEYSLTAVEIGIGATSVLTVMTYPMMSY
ncbi:hypothetical protein [Pseudomonas cerasi]